MKTCDSGVAATFRQVCRNGIRDVNQVHADVEYIGHIEEILELNYKRHYIVVLVCDFVKANYMGKNATIRKDKWGFTLAKYDKRPGVISKDSFAFPKHCKQVFYCNVRETTGWKIVMKKEVRGSGSFQTMKTIERQICSTWKKMNSLRASTHRWKLEKELSNHSQGYV